MTFDICRFVRLGLVPNGVELVLAEVRQHSGELSTARDFPMDHHRTARAVPLTQRHSGLSDRTPLWCSIGPRDENDTRIGRNAKGGATNPEARGRAA